VSRLPFTSQLDHQFYRRIYHFPVFILLPDEGQVVIACLYFQVMIRLAMGMMSQGVMRKPCPYPEACVRDKAPAIVT